MDEIINLNIGKLEDKLSLNETEKKIIDHISQAIGSIPKAVARFAGGWVRDKLLGLESDDYDIALENCSVDEFVNLLSKNLNNHNIFHKFHYNPNQSKHLQSCKFSIEDTIFLDFSKLRAETYNELSRIPQVSEGTPLDDSLRRDFTINALYYNINTSKIEDFTEIGFNDLKKSILRTPKDPLISFHEDPLRILRALRFASRFNLQYDPPIIEAAKNSSDAYNIKVTPERSSIEIMKCMEGNNPIRFLEDLINFGLFESVFDYMQMFDLDPKEALERIKIALSESDQKSVSLFTAALYSPLYGRGFVDPKKFGKKVDHIECAISRILRFPAHISIESKKMLTAANSLKNIKKLDRSEVGMAVRAAGPEWASGIPLIFDSEQRKRVKDEVVPFILSEGLGRAFALPLLVNARELSKLLPVPRGASIKPLVEDMAAWQLRNPGGSAEEYIAHARENLEDIFNSK